MYIFLQMWAVEQSKPLTVVHATCVDTPCVKQTLCSLGVGVELSCCVSAASYCIPM